MSEWTKEQKAAIETERRNLLVSAAAGSGKTAVLVERILRKLLRKEDPIQVTELLVVTFTRAAAAEMRERIEKALQKALTGLPEWTKEWTNSERNRMQRHVKKQILLLEQAEICTIDSFCSSIVRNYSAVIDLDPVTRLAKEDEIELIKSDVVEQMIEEEYQKEDSGIGDLSDYLGTSKAGDYLETEILSLYKFSRNAVDPERALEEYLAPYRIESVEELKTAPWHKAHVEALRDSLQEARSTAEELLRFTEEPGGPEYLRKTAEADLLSIMKALQATDYEDLRDLVDFKFVTLARIPKGAEVDPSAVDHAKDLRAHYKGILSGLKKAMAPSEEKILEELKAARPAAEELIRLTKRFGELLTEEKRRTRIMDFNDLEHYALDILTTDGKPSEIAESMISGYNEILIDEYQDSNELQEAILTSFAKRDPETNEPVNVFMVGDIKQSIYRFRQANPDLFNEKYKTYGTGAAANSPEKVELTANFRSRTGVTEAVNFLFKKLMHEGVGGVEYLDRVALNARGQFPETSLPVGNDTTILLVDPSAGETAMDPDEAEAHLVAQEIRRILDPKKGIHVAAEGSVRKASFRDVVILMRTLSHADTFRDVLESYGIPAYVKRKTGFYDTFEVQIMLDLLTVTDNPLDEVALTAVLHSPLVGLSSEELARIVAEGRKDAPKTYYAVLQDYAEGHADETAEKLRAFFARTERFRVLSAELKLSELMRIMYRETGLSLFVNALPGGEQRNGNLNELLEKAAEFERTSLSGIFNFVRYVARSRERSDEGEVGSVGENEDLVRIMTIHGSKGLEFPIVFVSGCKHEFNRMDERAPVLHYSKLGIGLRVVRPDKRTENRLPYFRSVVKDAIETDNLGEELRVLYVAMTRAKEKLYLTGFLKDSEKVLSGYEWTFSSGPETVYRSSILSAKSVLDWVLQAYRRHSPIRFSVLTAEQDLEPFAAAQEIETRLTKDALLSELEVPAPEEKAKELADLLGSSYRVDDLSEIYATLSVSALKKAGMPEFERPKPQEAVIKDDTKLSGAERGTLYHRVMENLDPAADPEAELFRLRKEGLISESEQGTIEVDDLRLFLRSDIGKRYARAFSAGKCRKEQQFIIGLPVREVFPEAQVRSQDELVMIQGVIDLYLEEEDGIVVVDYKTDRVRDPEILVREYRVQLDLYEKALTMMTGKTVKEKWIYSFVLGKGILL
ncbi:MAG: helicase-exonuclease AddAB subunit AddA [Lachnospiraceae bacterium]|nr:helicase-exonuclease AddAB subunit AddA [Lachnospiraceae bacterium]